MDALDSRLSVVACNTGGARSTKGYQARRGVEGADVYLQRSPVTTALQRSDLSEIFSHWAFEPYQVLDIMTAVVLIVVGAWALRKLVRWLLTILGRRKFLPTQLIEAARRTASTLIILVAFLLVLKSMGVSAKVLWSSVTGFLAVAAVAFFAAWSVLSNIFCALLLLTTRPFRVGRLHRSPRERGDARTPRHGQRHPVDLHDPHRERARSGEFCATGAQQPVLPAGRSPHECAARKSKSPLI